MYYSTRFARFPARARAVCVLATRETPRAVVRTPRPARAMTAAMDVDQTVDASTASEKKTVDVPHAVSDALDRANRRARATTTTRVLRSQTMGAISPAY